MKFRYTLLGGLLALSAWLMQSWAPWPVVQAQAVELNALLSGVNQIGVAGGSVPGSLAVYGAQAFPVVTGSSANNTREAVIAAARFDGGRALAFSHDGYLTGADFFTVGDNARFYRNAIAWVSNGKPSPRIGVLGISGLAARWRQLGFDAADGAFGNLAAFDVVCLAPNQHARGDLEALQNFVRDGGGLLAAATGWGWAQVNPTRELSEDFAGNFLLAPMGIVWTAAIPGRTSSAGYAAAPLPAPYVHAGAALDAVANNTTFSPAELAQVSKTLTLAARSAPLNDTLLLPRLATLTQNPNLNKAPSPQNPIAETDLLARLAIVVEFRQLSRTPVEQIRAHPAAAIFPGGAPASAARVARQRLIRVARQRWHGFGVYAPPGEALTVSVPANVANRGFSLRIGQHTDQLWSVTPWRRHPQISSGFPLTQAVTRVASPFGGLVYLEVPANATTDDFVAEVAGGVLAPFFVLGETTNEQWRAQIRHHPAPWGEIEGRRFVVTTLSTELRALDDAAAVAEAWDRVLDAQADLATRPRERAYPERFVCDEQIAAGYMHSGYPLMSHLDVKNDLVDVSVLLGNNADRTWGFYHEVGHNHQSGDWTFDGTGEVTVNLFTLYTHEFVANVPVTQNYRGSPAFVREQMAKYNFANPNFEQWKSDPFLALAMYLQLIHEFGWDAYKRVFAEYRALPANQRPQTDQDKRDQWMTRFSRQVGRNLGPFFLAWGVPTTLAARAALADLPVWLPDDLPVKPVATISAASYRPAHIAGRAIVAAFGVNLASSTAAATTVPLPQTLAGTTALVRDRAGVERAAPLFFVSPGQVNYQIPPGTTDGYTEVRVVSNNRNLSLGLINVAAAAPAFFTENQSGAGPAVALDAFTFTRAPFNATSANGAPNILVFFATGLGDDATDVDANVKDSVQVLIGDRPATVLYAGRAPGLVGLNQLNVQLPAGITSGIHTVVARRNNHASNAVTIAIN